MYSIAIESRVTTEKSKNQIEFKNAYIPSLRLWNYFQIIRPVGPVGLDCQVRMIDVNLLRSLAGEESSGVRLMKDHELTLSLSQSFATDVEFGVTKVLLSKFLEFEPR